MKILDDESSAQLDAFSQWSHGRLLPSLRHALGWFIMIGFPWFFMGFCISFVVNMIAGGVL